MCEHSDREQLVITVEVRSPEKTIRALRQEMCIECLANWTDDFSSCLTNLRHRRMREKEGAQVLEEQLAGRRTYQNMPVRGARDQVVQFGKLRRMANG